MVTGCSGFYVFETFPHVYHAVDVSADVVTSAAHLTACENRGNQGIHRFDPILDRFGPSAGPPGPADFDHPISGSRDREMDP